MMHKYKSVNQKIYTNKRKEKLLAGKYLRITSYQLTFKSLCRSTKFVEANSIFLFTLFWYLVKHVGIKFTEFIHEIGSRGD